MAAIYRPPTPQTTFRVGIWNNMVLRHYLLEYVLETFKGHYLLLVHFGVGT